MVRAGIARWIFVLMALGGADGVYAQTRPAIEPAKAKVAFAEAEAVSTRDGGRLWGRALYGPMLFVDPASNAVVANQADRAGSLHGDGGVFVGVLPPTIPAANTAVDWLGTHWTMVMWPLPEDSQARQRLMAHELFHRIQDGLHLPAANPENPQLDDLEGRVWLQLEWRALAVALLARGAAQDEAVGDALRFAEERHRLFARSGETERALELNEGLAEYTGVRAAAPDRETAVWRAVARLSAPDRETTFVRSFAYTSGPAYGLLLDMRMPAWRKRLTATSDLAAMLAGTIHKGVAGNAARRAAVYGGNGLRVTERERAARAEAGRARYRSLLVEGATLTLPTSDAFNYGFDPNGLVPLGDLGTVYPTMHATDAWGVLEAEQGALFHAKAGQLRVAAGAALHAGGARLAGPGWTLELKPGWRAVPGERAGDFVLRKD